MIHTRPRPSTGGGITGFALASHVGWGVLPGCGGAVLALGLLTTGSWARHTAEVIAAEFPAEPAELADSEEELAPPGPDHAA